MRASIPPALALLLAGLVALQARPGHASPAQPPRYCSNKCYRNKWRARRDCRSRRRPLPGCRVNRCVAHVPRKELGWACKPLRPGLPSRPRCYRRWARAARACHLRSRERRVLPHTGYSHIKSVRPCFFYVVRKARGWKCGAAPSPSTTPTASPSPSTTPQPTFIAGTFRAAESFTDASVVTATDGSGSTYNVSYNVTLPRGGVVSLDGVKDITQVTCFVNGSVRVSVGAGVALPATLAEMYPLGAVLVIGQDKFGACDLAPASLQPGSGAGDNDADFRAAVNNEALFQDAFLIIETVSGTVNNALVSGSAASYFALFERGSISIKANSPTNSSTVLAPSVRQVLPTTSRAVLLKLDSPVLSVGPLKLNLQGTGSYNGQFESFTANWGNTFIDIEFKFIDEWEISLSLDAEISGGLGKEKLVKDLLSIPLYGIPPIDFLSKLDTGRFTLPTFKLGFYFEIPLIVRVDVNVKKGLGNVAKATYRTARTHITSYIRGGFLNLDYGTDVKTLVPSSRSFDYKPSLTFTEPTELSIDVFTGVRPQFAAYVPIFYARASLDLGMSFEGKYAPGADSAFPPISSGGGFKNGRCDDCHDIELAGVGKVANAGVFVGLSLKFKFKVWKINIPVKLVNKVLAQVTLPGNPSLNLPIATGCYIEPIGKDNNPLVFLKAQNTCGACPMDKPKFNPTRKECEENCTEPTKPFFNIATGMCEGCPPQTPVYNQKLQVCEGKCPGGSQAGNNVPFYGSFELGSPNGTFVFQRTHYTVKDQAEVIYEGKVIHDTGCTGGTESVKLTYAGSATNVIVKMTPNCAGTSGTQWTFNVACPA